MYITACSTISFQDTFGNNGFSNQLMPLTNSSAIRHPDYTLFISAMDRRRMSDVLKMAITCTLDCLQQINLPQPDAIIVGTSMGCCTHTKVFLDKIYLADGGLISPTAFIHSTHNTIAGQISLLLKNHSYNITHTHNSLSFENALIDALLCADDGCSNILVGAADELELELHNFAARLNAQINNPAFGASFFILSADKKINEPNVSLVDVGSFALIDNFNDTIIQFLNNNNINSASIDLVLYCTNHKHLLLDLQNIFLDSQTINYQKYSGDYYTNSAFAFNLAVDILQQQDNSNITYILICNNFVANNLGLMLVKKHNN